MGDNLNAGDNYVLRVKLENLVDGSTQSDNYALMGQDIRFYIRQPNNEELYASTASVTDRGMIQEFDLYTDGEINYGSDFDGNGITNLQDFATFVWQWLHPSLIVWACLPLILARKRRFFDVGFNGLCQKELTTLSSCQPFDYIGRSFLSPQMIGEGLSDILPWIGLCAL